MWRQYVAAHVVKKMQRYKLNFPTTQQCTVQNTRQTIGFSVNVPKCCT